MDLDKGQLLKQYTRNDPGRWKRNGFTKFPNKAIHDKNLGKLEIAVLLVLISRAFKGKNASFPTLRTIQKESRYSRNSVLKATKNLEKFGYIRVERAKKNSKKANRYYPLE
jgi:DNA-binding MarR family transcriptional regulator